MSFRFPILLVFFLLFLEGSRKSFVPNSDFSGSKFLKNKDFSLDKISVRESTVDLQISVGDKIFVFGKARGTLEKVKVGMHVLPFSQVPGSQGNESTFTNVSWKKLKDGSIQILSSYNPWPMSLAWTVFASGELKMEASAPPLNSLNDEWLGLGFNYPEHQLYQVSWIGKSALQPDKSGQWKNENFVSLEDSGQKTESEPTAFFQQIQTVKLEFESVIVDVRTDNSGVYLGFGNPENQVSNFPKMNSDLGFLVKQAKAETDTHPQTTSVNGHGKNTVSLNPLVLWFHFQ